MYGTLDPIAIYEGFMAGSREPFDPFDLPTLRCLCEPRNARRRELHIVVEPARYCLVYDPVLLLIQQPDQPPLRAD